jgi:UDP-N-acetylglucosamine 2-epimerase (non-hydrolysing)/GDP/UDP-N,N'-diacetylbacillosamine 2-epimerase (hydrolysing)
MEAASVPLPVVDVGIRQRGRERARCVLHAPADPSQIAAAILAATQPSFVAGLRGLVNPYGDGHAAPRIRKILTELPLDERLLRKPPVPLSATLPERESATP